MHSLHTVMNKLHKLKNFSSFQQKGVVYMSDIDREFEEFVRKNYKILTENQKKLCEHLGINIPH